MKKIIMVCGFQGTGKSTTSRELATRLPGTYFLDSDEFYIKAEEKPQNIDERSEEERTKRREKYIARKAAEIERLLDLHDAVITDGLFTRESERRFIKDLALKRDARLIPILITCPEDIVKERVSAQENHIMTPENRMKAHARAKENWEDIEEDHIRIDSSKDVDYEKIIEHIRSGEDK
jgi:predicted kinase